MVLWRQVWTQQADGSQRHRALGKEVQNDRIRARRTRGFDPAIGRMFGQVKDTRAVREE